MAASIAAVAGASVLFLTLTVFSPRLQPMSAHFERGSEEEARWRTWVNRVGRSRLARKLTTALLERRIQLAGRPVPIESVLGMKLILAFGTVVLLVLTALVAAAVVLVLPIAVPAAFRIPDMALARMAKARLGRISDQVSDLADVLVVMTDAGISPAAAFRRAAEVMPDPLGAELAGVIRRLDLGVPWRSAVTEMTERTDVRPLKRLVRVLARSQRLGTSITSVLRTMATDLRAERRAEAELAARQAPVKMLFPLVLLILPAFLLLTVGPVVLSTIRSLS